jgi:Xaa-Pro aminopeptidase
VFDHGRRLDTVRAAMARRGIDCLLLSIGADLAYVTGYEAMPLERLTMLAVTAGRAPVLVVPELEAPRVPAGPFEVHPWSEREDPVAIVAAHAGRPAVVAVGDQTWSRFLLELLSLMSHATFVSAGPLMSSVRAVKGEDEIEALRRVAEAADRVSARIPHDVRFVGRTERRIARDVVDLMIEEGHQVAGFWIVGSGPNGASPHHEPGDRVVEAGDPVVVDFGGRLDGYCSDTTRMFVAGTPGPELVDVHRVVLEAQQAGKDAARAGVPAQEVDSAARSVIDAAGYGERFIHRLGHGIGLEAHEHPYLVAGNATPLQPGNAFSIEPGVYLPGRFGVRIEDIAVIGADGSLEVLNDAERGHVEVG